MIVNHIGDIGAIILSKALRGNTKSVKLNLGCDDDKNRRLMKAIHQVLLAPIGNNIGQFGITSLKQASEASPEFIEVDVDGEDIKLNEVVHECQ